MIEKVKITAEQAEMLKAYKRISDKETGKKLNDLEFFIEMRHTFVDSFECLKGFTIEEFAKLLYVRNSYEIEPQYKVGDWVVNSANGRFAKVERVAPDRVWVDDEKARYFLKSSLRHATPEEIKAEKERRVWAGIGRENIGFKQGDVAVDKAGYFYTDKSDIEEVYAEAALKGFYPAESFIEFGGGEDV
ncbi:hypothetical protein H9649_07555 [Sporosarcina sp. Sa2YVA2]|uniref:Uncharacterized protein n=1 Tax=Sporosarcina quadrami TaxID=2762234 RepID=A0ABR8U8S3_9BACL|nr:hypothetical protein [Sporosarcina quadrami]MBD7984430.1 hypothetical protein [Sporosarcina quadrami]